MTALGPNVLQNYFWTPREQHRFNVPFDYCSLIDVEFCRDLKISQNRVYNLNIEMSADRFKSKRDGARLLSINPVATVWIRVRWHGPFLARRLRRLHRAPVTSRPSHSCFQASCLWPLSLFCHRSLRSLAQCSISLTISSRNASTTLTTKL